MITVSIVEDNETYRQALVQMLEGDLQFSLAGVYSSAEAGMAMLKAAPDLAIIDLQLPGMSGAELILKLRQSSIATQFVVCSVCDDDEHIFSALEAGASGYLLKESTAEQILAALRDLYQGGAPMSPYIARRVIASFQKKPVLISEALSRREIEVLQLLAKGLQYKEIANCLFVSHETVKKHLKNIYSKLHVQNKVEALNKFRMM
jgi:two-component system, NarL family, response regulator LiaR